MSQNPVHTIRKGLIKATIWQNETEKGTFYRTTIMNLYRKGEKWKSSNSFTRDQLLVVARLAQEANAWIYENAKKDAGKPKSDAATDGNAAA